jgi:hypothetical protein
MVEKHGRNIVRKILEPYIVRLNENDFRIEYSYRDIGGRGYILHDDVETTGAEWSLVLWNPMTNEYRELDT